MQDLGVYLVYDAISWFGIPKDVHYYPVKLRNGIDGSGTAILNYPGYDVVLNVGKTANSYLPGEVYGLKETIVIDEADELLGEAETLADCREIITHAPRTAAVSFFSATKAPILSELHRWFGIEPTVIDVRQVDQT